MIIVVTAIDIAATGLLGLWLTIMWGWFAVPAGLPVVSYLHLLGMAFMAATVTHQPQPLEQTSLERATYGIVMPAIMFAAGAVVHFIDVWFRG